MNLFIKFGIVYGILGVFTSFLYIFTLIRDDLKMNNKSEFRELAFDYGVTLAITVIFWPVIVIDKIALRKK